LVSENQPADQPARQGTPPAAPSQGAAGFLMIGAGIIVAGHLLFSVILDRFSFGATYVALALITLLSILGIGGFDFVTNRVKKLIGTFIGVAGLLILVDDIRSGFPDGIGILAVLAFYAGAALMFVGARALKD
jgi:hypothetical protein